MGGQWPGSGRGHQWWGAAHPAQTGMFSTPLLPGVGLALMAAFSAWKEETHACSRQKKGGQSSKNMMVIMTRSAVSVHAAVASRSTHATIIISRPEDGAMTGPAGRYTARRAHRSVDLHAAGGRSRADNSDQSGP